MILHMPIFYNWLIWYKNHHAPQGHVCKLGSSDDDPMECQVCQLAEIFQGYWAGETDETDWMSTFDSLTKSLLHSWKPAGTDSEQDPVEYFGVLYNAIKESTKLMMRGDLEEMFEVEIITVKKCAGENPCVPNYTSNAQPVMMIHLSGEEDDELPKNPTLSDVIQRHFDHEDYWDECGKCGGTMTATDQIGSFPELLLVQLNRVDQTGNKITTKVSLSEQLNIETRFIDERWGNKRKVIQYKLSSVVLHHGEQTTFGHYSVGLKGKGDKWTIASDSAVRDWIPEGPQGDLKHLSTGYLFTYRRLPINDIQTTGTKRIPNPEPMEIDSGLFADSDFRHDVKCLEQLLDAMIPKAIDTYISRTADLRRKEFEKWANEWEKGKVQGKDQGTDEEIVNWTKERGRLEITLTRDKGKGSKLLDLEVQGMHFNRLQKNKRPREEEEEVEKIVEKEVEKEKTFGRMMRKVKGKAKEYEGNVKKKMKT
ncbi:Peptidase C19, ubiquitin carboxyl-terminal hydrolase 2 [Penicillium griseofulvum]|uniref:Peptidase C19, ubiquitin carboxyl-terminal hydrolase 2 n=1 Tax=Penicillium patulum TaxID=5078 RepID=A0A135LKK4_PENPA|nr:Peptidase C19, ubiquitin carboxyl-terminal hydrolase 2 [Penicillium griseofulvum]KXG49458.1 Peptidase C19, ubiquitin carboxyl-terminal hydrolase 2 [Penicillium griseofulvum]